MRWAVILAGGSGSRFWPLSTPSRPKQLLPLCGPGSTAEAAVARLAGLIDPARILLVTGPRLAGPLTERLGLPAANVLIEPAPKSTGPALAWASHEAVRRDPGAVVLSMHADWHIPDVQGFARVALEALETAEDQELLVTVGVVPTRPETGYGYIVPGQPVGRARRVDQFTEKPSASTAAALIAAGALWNSGLFAWSGRTLLREVSLHSPEIGPALAHLDRQAIEPFFDACREVSIDVGVLERSAQVAVVRGDFTWDDIGTWEALARVRPADAAGNVLVGPVVAVGSTGCIGWSEGHPIVLGGVSNLVVVEANGRILVIDRSRAADLKQILEALPREIRET